MKLAGILAASCAILAAMAQAKPVQKEHGHSQSEHGHSQGQTGMMDDNIDVQHATANKPYKFTGPNGVNYVKGRQFDRIFQIVGVI